MGSQSVKDGIPSEADTQRGSFVIIERWVRRSSILLRTMLRRVEEEMEENTGLALHMAPGRPPSRAPRSSRVL
jgi:hypothetical protein